MNRRTFLKSIATACGAVVVCPGELLKEPVEFRPNPVQMKWIHYYITYKYDSSNLDKLRAAFLVHSFEPPFRW